MDVEEEPEKDGDKEKYQWCGKRFTALRGLKIHQGKVCKRKESIQQHGLEGRETSRENPLESNHSGINTTVE